MSDPQSGDDPQAGQQPAAPPARRRTYYTLEELMTHVRDRDAAADAGGYPFYRRACYARLLADGDVMNLLHRVRTGAVATESLEVMLRFYHAWAGHDGAGPEYPLWTVGEFAKIITADYDFMLRHLMKRWNVAADGKKELEAQLDTMAMASAAAVEIAALTTGPDAVAEYDLAMLHGFVWAQRAIHRGMEAVGGFVFTDGFRKLLMSEARGLADLVIQAVAGYPGVTAAVAVSHYGDYRLDQLVEKAGRLMRGEYVDGLADDAEEDEEKKRRDLNEELGQTIQALAAEKEIGGRLDSEKNDLVLQAGQTIADFLKGLAIAAAEQEQGQGVTTGDGDGAGGGEDEQEKEADVGALLDQSFTVYVNQRKQQLKVMQIVHAIQIGRQVAFANKQDMKRFNDATEHKYSASVSAMTPDQLRALASKPPPHAKLLEAEFDDMLRHQRLNRKSRNVDLNHNGIPDHLEGQMLHGEAEAAEISGQQHHQQQNMQRQQHKEVKQQRKEVRQQSSRKSWDVNNDGIPDHLQQGVSKSSGPKPRRSDPGSTRTPEQREEHREARHHKREERRTHREEKQHDAPRRDKAPSASKSGGGKVKMSDVIGEVKMGSHLQVKSNAMTTNPTPLPQDKQVQR